jgi:methionine sulfoxide reductase heme-binding subunit
MTTWIILRAAGIGAYLMLFLSVMWGLMATAAPLGRRIAKASATTVHQFMATTGLVLLAIHVGGLLLDSFMPFRPKDVLVPGHSSFKAIPVAVGIVAMYMLVFVVVASWMRRALGTMWWRRTHLLAVPTFTLALVHGLFTGTDTVRPWMWWIYLVTGLTVFFLVALRGLTVGFRPLRATQTAHLARVRPITEMAREPVSGRR